MIQFSNNNDNNLIDDNNNIFNYVYIGKKHMKKYQYELIHDLVSVFMYFCHRLCVCGGRGDV